jgi:nucleotide-binding universal stress UspA family protein
MKTILVPTDFSPVAENAMRFAADMAQHIKAAVLLLHVYQLPVVVSEVAMVMTGEGELRAESDERLNELKEKLEKLTMGRVPVFIQSRYGSVTNELEDACANINPFVVVMGTMGMGKMERMMFGSTTLTAIRRLHAPVMVIPPGVVFSPVQKIGLACDFKNVQTCTPKKEIKAVVNEFGAELHVVNVDRGFKHYAPAAREQSTLLHNMLEELHPHYHFICRENIEESLDEFALRNQIGFLIVVPKKHSFTGGLFHKSCSNELVTHAHVPVMAIHE